MMEAVATEDTGRRKLDQYFTDQRVANALVGMLERDCFWRGGAILEPSAGKGAFIRSVTCLAPSAESVEALDIDAERARELGQFGKPVCEYQADFLEWKPTTGYELIVGNPPYTDAERHVRHALSLRARCGVVAFLLRLAFLESQERVGFWKEHPASKVYVLSQRPSFTGGGTDNSAYGFFVWDKCCRTQTTLEVISWK